MVIIYIQELTPITKIKNAIYVNTFLHVNIYTRNNRYMYIMAIIDINNKLWINYNLYKKEFEFILNDIKKIKIYSDYDNTFGMATDINNNIIAIENKNIIPLDQDIKFYWTYSTNRYILNKQNTLQFTNTSDLSDILKKRNIPYTNILNDNIITNVKDMDLIDNTKSYYIIKFMNGEIVVYDETLFTYNSVEDIIKKYNPIKSNIDLVSYDPNIQINFIFTSKYII